MKKLFTNLKVALTLLLLCGVCSVWAETTATLTLSSSKKFAMSSPSTLTDDCGNTWTCTGSSIQNSYQSAYSGQQFGTGSTNYVFSFKASFTNKIIKSVSVYMAAGGTTATYDISVGNTSWKNGNLTKTATTYTATGEASGDIEITLDQNKGGKAVYLGEIKVIYEDAAPKNLESIEVSGTPTKTTYKEGEEFDPAGLTVTGTYDDETKEKLTSGIEWTINPSGALTLGTTSVSVVATASGISSDSYAVNVEVTEKPVLPSYALVTDASTLMDGDVIVLGATKSDTWFVNGGHSGTNKFLDSKTATYEDGILESSEAGEISLIAVDGGWNLKIGDKYINTTAAKALTFGDDASTVWTISITDGTATVSAGDYGRFLYNVSSPRFLNYATTTSTSASMLLPQIFKKKVTRTQDVTITPVGWATACLPFNAKITSGKATAYYVTGTSGNALEKVEAEVIPAREGVLLKSNNGGEATVTFTEAANADEVTTNYMKGSLDGEPFVATGFTYYILTLGNDDKLGFYYDPETNNSGATATCPAGKAVLAVPGANAKSFFSLFDEDVTGINNVDMNKKNNGIRYNLNGQAVGSDFKGVVIVNGKKFIK